MNHSPYLHDQIQAALIGLDEVASALEKRWGVGRLVRLVSDTTRLRFKMANDLLSQAIASNSPATVAKQAEMMRRAWAALDAEATAAGCAVLNLVVWEQRMDDGRVLCLVQTNAEAAAVAAEGRAVEIWTMAEAARVLGAHGLLSAIKQSFPGARVDRVLPRTEGFAQDWASNDPMNELLREDELRVPEAAQ